MTRLSGFLGVRAGEQRLVGWMVALFATTQAGHGLGANTGDALFFVRFGVEFLPHMILLSGLLAMVAVLAYGGGLGRVGTRRFLPGVAAGLAALLVAERVSVGFVVPGLYAAIWLTEQLVILITFTMMWNAASEACEPRQAKRLFPLFASAGIAGGMVGNLATGPLATTLGTANLLLVHAGLLVGVVALLVEVGRRFFRPRGEPSPSVLADLQAGFRVTVRSGLLRLVSAAAVALSILFFLVVFPFSEQVAGSFRSDTDVAAFLGYFSGAATAASFLVSLLVTNRVLARLGVTATVLVVPLIYLAGFGLWAVSFTLVTATLVRGAQWVAVNALLATAWTSVFNVVEPSRRSQVLAFVTAVPAQLGVVASGALLVAGSAAFTDRQLALVGLAIAAVTSAVVWRMRRAYAAALLDAVERGLVDVFTSTAPSLRRPVTDADVVRALTRALGDDRPPVRRVAATLLGRLDGDAAAVPLLRAARDEDVAVRTAALRSLDDDHGDSVALEALDDPAPDVRREAVRILAGLGAQARDPLEARLADPDPQVRAAAAGALRSGPARELLGVMLRSGSTAEILAALDVLPDWEEACRDLGAARFLAHPRPAVRLGAARAQVRQPDAVEVVRLLDDPDAAVRDGVARLLRGRSELTPELLGVLAHGSERAQEAAVEALRGKPEARAALVDWAAAKIERAAVLRGHRDALGAPAFPEPAHRYLRRVLQHRERDAEYRAMCALDVLAGRESLQLLIRGSRSADQQLRGQALEALDAIGDRRLTRRLLPLLEDDPDTTARPAPVSVLSSLLDDTDEWLRALACRAVAVRLVAEWRDLTERAARDASPLVRGAVRRNGDEMAADVDTMDLIDRILVLQEVPMFSDLDPEDLERIAHISQERVYTPDEVVYREGEPGDEMLVIARGRVCIRKVVDGEPRLLRTFGPGEHVGELALLRGRPRASDVVAHEVEVRALAIRAPEFESILNERPGVAMAMLATLAERLGTST
ncbi:MAG TPA: HEAT repeat domain-containing protein [Nitriliruptorales bacterium]|nr:HEAT repeat domain-containing protein [Nitriliruptorales bacterium]